MNNKKGDKEYIDLRIILEFVIEPMEVKVLKGDYIITKELLLVELIHPHRYRCSYIGTLPIY